MIRSLLRSYPLPCSVLIGLLTGLLLRFVFGLPEWGEGVWMVTLIAGGAPIVWKTVKGMFRGEFASDIVAMLAIVTALVMQEWFAGAIVVLMQSGGEALEAYGLKRASSSLEALLKRAPSVAYRKEGEGLKKISVAEVVVGDRLVVRPGDLIPVDGTILEGKAEIDESAITGEPLAHSKRKQAQVLSGSAVVSGSFEMRADKLSQESQYAKIVELVRKAQEEKAPIQRLADRYAIFFTPLTLFMSLLGFLITRDPTTVLSVLVVATPCPLILATPVAIISAINRAARAGIIVKGGAPMEQVGKADLVLFDKTGTITFGAPFVEASLRLNGTSEEELLYKAGVVEQLSSHVVAQAIAHRALEVFQKLPLPQNFREFPGRGVEADFQGEHLVIGSFPFLEERLGKGVLEHHAHQIEETHVHGKLTVFIAIDGTLAGMLILSDKIRQGVPQMVQELKELGVEDTMLLTGDSAENARLIALQAGIKHVRADLLPEQKVEVLHHLREAGKRTLMVGDGINDAPALATATVGIAMGAHGTAISAEAAEIVLLVDDVTKVAEAIRIGQRMLRVAKESIGVGMGLSFLLMVIASFGFIPPAVGALLQEIIDAAVIINALRAR